MADWIDITAYRGYWDVPRMFLIEYNGRILLFDCPFDEALDDYGADFRVYEMRKCDVAALPNDWSVLPSQGTYVGRIAIRDVTFDASRCRKVWCSAIDDLIARR